MLLFLFLFLFFFYFFLSAYSATWCEYNIVNGLITYESDGDDTTCNRVGWDYQKCSGEGVDTFIFNNSCCSLQNMTLLFYNDDKWKKHINFTSGNNDSILSSITTINTFNQMKQVINTKNMKNGVSFYLGCFETDYYSYKRVDSGSSSNYYCRSSVNDSAKTYVEIYSSDLILYGDDVDQKFELYFKLKTTTQPYLFVSGISKQSIFIYFDVEMTNDYLSNGVYYLFTSFNINTPSTQKLTNNYIIYKICSRESIERYGIIKSSTTLTDCSCILNSGGVISTSTLFNYPDCTYNSTMFDLTLPNTIDKYIINDLLEWYSVVFTKSSQSIEINEGTTLIIDELDINRNDISFNGNVNVTNLIITNIGASFDGLNFDDITTSSLNNDTMLFTIQSTSTDLESFGLMQCGNIVAKSTTSTCNCHYNGTVNEYYNDYNEIDLICNSIKNEEFNYKSLLINSSEYLINSNEYWNILEINEDSLILNGVSILTSNLCEFEDKTITINCNLYCETMNINSNTILIVNNELIIDTLVITDKINNNLNENGIIESYGSIEITSIEHTESQSNCFELISSNESLSQPLINFNYSTLLLSQNHLLRICPSSNTNYEVQCTTIGDTFEQQSFDLLHCPCIDEKCIINVNTTQLDMRNIKFDGTFNILTNSTIDISYKTSAFSIEYEDDKQILFIGNGAIGFETLLKTNSLKSETTLPIESSNQLPCKALLIQYDNQQCIIEDNTTYPNVGDIDNCQLQNGFGCEICYEGYESNVTYCNECSSNCLRCYNNECINCEMNYQLNDTNHCELISDPIEIFDNNKTMKCNYGYYSNTNQCIKCSYSNCITCNSSQCLTCNTNYTLNNGNCQLIEIQVGEEIISNFGVIDCNDGYYLNNSQCIDCSLTFDNCKICNINGCLNCNSGYVLLNDNTCSLNTNCFIIENSICLSCNDKGSWFNGNECEECGDNCKNCINGYCVECNDSYILQNHNNCTENVYPDNCITLSYYGTCQRCSDGYYLNNNLCYECSNECTTCHNITYCFECNNGYMLNDNNECVDMSELNANCKTAIPGSSGGCAICNDGYYRDQTSCYPCISNCTKCNNGESCLTCESNYFLLNDASECISYDDLTNCETPTQSGCTKCNDSYYLSNQYCISCSDTTENCNTCNNNGECLTCQTNHILINYKCIHYQLIDNCKESSDSKCSSCSFWHTLNEDQTRCDTHIVWWVIVLIVLFILIILIGIYVLIWYVIKFYLDLRKQQKQRKQTTIFDMKTSNIQFIPTNNKDVVINKNEILFNDEYEEIGVNEETRDLICVGNTSKHTIKVQFSVKEGCDKYEIRTNPQLITIPKGKAIEFEIFIKPLCTCKINDQIMLISVDLTKGKTITTSITINTITIMTSRLDYNELIEDVKLGEGSFGIVYKGTFRGNQVAIKKMKQAQDIEETIEEFNKEVTMLDKFRNDYIIHFYGAVFIPNKICMVTEFAQHGSLQDLINKTKDKPIDNTMKMKILLDCSKGISYLHSNGILHRDIKPDNFLILSLDTNVAVNAKLTDFGSSRNINMLMTNMTFTKGIGTPVYMAPEILQQEKYKKSADIYSFAITIYETMIWDEAYDKTKFKFSWKIAEFVTNGERLSKPDTMNESIYSLIDKCWKQDSKERYSIEDVIGKLEELRE